MYFYMFIVCLNTMTSMITTHTFVNIIDFQVHGRRRKHEFGHVDPACEAFEEVLHPHRSIDAVEVFTGQGRWVKHVFRGSYACPFFLPLFSILVFSRQLFNALCSMLCVQSLCSILQMLVFNACFQSLVSIFGFNPCLQSLCPILVCNPFCLSTQAIN